MLVVDSVENVDLAREGRALLAQRRDHVGIDVASNAAGHDVIHQQPVPERALVEPQHVLAQPGELGEAEREPAVVAEVAEVAQMVADALALEGERAQPRGARRRCDAGDGFQRLRVGARIRDGPVAGNASRQPVPLGERHRLEALFDPLVHVPEALLEAQHLFADDLEAEMSRLDDAGVHRPDGDLVNAVAFDADECVVLLARLPLRRRGEIAAQRELVDRPRGHPRPRALVVGVGRDADEVECRALHPFPPPER